MYGRYGIDHLSKFTVSLAIIFMVLANIFDSSLFAMFSWFLLFYSYFRMFSRNIYKRAAENQKYLAKTSHIRSWIYQQKNLFQQKKTHHIYKCPGCSQKIRIPRGKGRIEIRCPKCNTTFIKKS